MSERVSTVQRSKAQLESLGEGRFRVSGLLDAGTVTRLLADSETRFGNEPQIVVNLHNVTESDSSGLALLLEWLRLARARGRQIHFEEIPEQVMALARISEVDDLLLESEPAVVPQPAAADAVLKQA